MNKMKYVFLGLGFMVASMVEAASRNMGDDTSTRYAYITFGPLTDFTVEQVEIEGKTYVVSPHIGPHKVLKIAIAKGTKIPPLTITGKLDSDGSSLRVGSNNVWAEAECQGDVGYLLHMTYTKYGTGSDYETKEFIAGHHPRQEPTIAIRPILETEKSKATLIE